METRIISFIPPIAGIDGAFNTFRLGTFYNKHLSPGEEVFLLNEKDKMIIGRAVVEKIEFGDLGEMCLLYASQNHTELGKDPIEAPKRLYATLVKIYGPKIVSINKKVTVIFLRRTE